jgi:hypothetical protein
MQTDQPAQLTAAIYQAAWWVRHYARPNQRKQKAQAIQRLGLTIRAAFNDTEDFEPLLYALCCSLSETGDIRFAIGRD